jgi:transposase-like protein
MKCNNDDFMEGKMKRNVPKRRYTPEYREAAVRQVIDAKRALAEMARNLEISHKTLANWVRRARTKETLVKREPVVAPDKPWSSRSCERRMRGFAWTTRS